VAQEILFGYLSDTPEDTVGGIRPPGCAHPLWAPLAAAASRRGSAAKKAAPLATKRPGWGRGDYPHALTLTSSFGGVAELTG
jgi:hypothetical protein